MRRLVILASLATGLTAEVAGTPIAPRPGALPGAWFSWTNDALSGQLGDNTDDFRTSAFQIQARVWRRLILDLDLSTLTDKAQAYRATARADEGTVTAGWLFGEGDEQIGQHWLAAGLGVRFYRNLGGEAMQNAFHRSINIAPVDYLDYDPPSTVGLAYLASGWTLPLIDIPSTPFLERGQLALAFNGQVALTSEVLVQGSSEVAFAALGQDGSVWLGMRITDETGRQQGRTATTVSEHEEGAWVTYGTSVGGWFVAGAMEPSTKAATGRVGWQWQRRPGRIDDGSRARLAGELTVLPGPSLGATLRWQPLWLSNSPLGEYGWITGTYRFGRTGVTWDDNVVVYDQGTLGLQLTGNPSSAGLHWDPYVETGLGARAERVAVRGTVTRYEPDRSVTTVATAAVGLRLVWGPEPVGARTAQYGLGCGLEGWLPFQSQRIDNGTQSDRYNTPAWTIGAAVSVRAQW